VISPASNGKTHSVTIVIPVLNEAHVLETSVEKVCTFLRKTSFPYCWELLIADNGSVDGTQDVARMLAAKYEDVRFVHLLQRGRGRALRHAWFHSGADVVCYMDVDLSTDLSHLLELVNAVAKEDYDLATGSRLLRASRTKRSFKREFISRAYNIFIKLMLATRFSDAQCGFKSLTRKAVEQIVPQIEDQSWFFDTELLVLAEKQGLRIKDIPVVWTEDDDSRVKIAQTAWDDIKGVFRLRQSLWRKPAKVAVADADTRDR
jgi:glycosyltransferase involved in cell wall biosynthesis